MEYFNVVLFASMLFGFGAAQQVALVNGTEAGIGYVMVRASNGTWGYVCDDCWSLDAARIACNQIGYSGAAKPGARAEFLLAPGNPIIALDDLDCDATHTSLTQCIANFTDNLWFVSNCNVNELARATCIDDPDPVPQVPNHTLLCNSNSMQVIYANWTILPANLQNRLVNNGLRYLTIPYSSAEVAVTQTMTYIIYTNNIVMSYPLHGIGANKYLRYDAALTCRMKREATVNKTFEPYGNITLANYTHFEIEMLFYEDRMFTTEVATYPYQLLMGDWLNMAVILYTTDPRLKLVVSQCLAEPVVTSGRGPKLIFYNNKCLVDDQTSATYPLSKNRFGFRFQSFVFERYDTVRLECDAIVCLKTDQSASCDRSCNSAKPDTDKRRRRQVFDISGTDHTVYSVFSPLIHVVNPTNGPTPLMAVTPSTVSPSTVRATTVNTPVSQVEPDLDNLVMILGSAASLPSLLVVYVVTPLVAALMSA
ncbi:scavenger receptor cysteine-rich domain-containing protein DMBT1-like [Littorina saxatilis]|uniref:scavenger receptor cysteine-rich domain-containing protein DMBT1-like n=1 Tax=Littorina saxatilis TaxID=31220 RepID=UPI0038B50B64